MKYYVSAVEKIYLRLIKFSDSQIHIFLYELILHFCCEVHQTLSFNQCQRYNGSVVLAEQRQEQNSMIYGMLRIFHLLLLPR